MTAPLISPELQRTFRLALQDASKRRHEFLTLEHLLLALTREAKTQDFLTACRAPVTRLRQRLEDFLDQTMEKLPEGTRADPVQTIGIERVLQRAAITALCADQSVIEGTEVLLAMFREDESHALSLLRQEGLTRLGLLKYLCREDEHRLREPGDWMNRITQITELLKKLQATHGTRAASTPVAGAGVESHAVHAALEQALPLVEVLALPLTKQDVDDIDKAVDDAERLRLLAGHLRKHSRSAAMAAEYVEQATDAVVARLKAEGSHSDR